MDNQKLIQYLLIGLIICWILKKPVENFVLTSSIPVGSNISAPPLNSMQPIPAGPASSITTSIDDPSAYYIKGSLNAVGQQAVQQANAIGVNNTTTCSLPQNVYIKLPPTDAVCKTDIMSLYDIPTDSAATCSIVDPATGKKAKTITLKSDNQITLASGYNGGRSCSQQNPATQTMICGTIEPTCPDNDNSFYTFSSSATIGGQ